MPLVIPCPSCNAKLKAPETLIGKTVKCPNCQAAIPVRAPSNTPAPKAAAAPAKKPAPPPADDFNFDDDPDERPSKKGAVKKGRDDDYDDDRPAKKPAKARDDDYEEDERPSKKGAIKKGRDEYIDDEPPRKAKGRRDDEDDYDDEDRPSKKKGKKGKSGPGGPTTDEERSNAFMIYIAALVGQFIGIGPFGGIIWWLIKRGDSKYVDHHGKEFMNLMITNFLIAMLCVVLIIIGFVVGGSTDQWIFTAIFAGLGFLALGVWSLAAFIFMIIAMFKAKAGEWYRIPMIWHILKV